MGATDMPQTASHDAPALQAAFIVANTYLMAPPLVPEIVLHLAEESLPIWAKTENELAEMGLIDPYWAFAWAGGQALARFVLDHREIVAGRRVIDLGSGSGLAAIAAKIAGAEDVLAADTDPFAVAAITTNALANGVEMRITGDDLLTAPKRLAGDVLVLGDVFYDAALAVRVLAAASAAAAAGTVVLVGDPRRAYFPQHRFEKLAQYVVPVTRELEDAEIKACAVWRLSCQTHAGLDASTAAPYRQARRICN
jgi:predicted nicotinamide N-methyase